MLISNDSFSRLSDLLEHFFLEGVETKESSEIINLTRIDYNNGISGFVFFVDRNFSDFSNNFHAIYNLSEDHAFAVKMRTSFERNIKLRRVSIAAAVCHGE